MSTKYTVKKKDKDVNKIVILKSGIEYEFTLPEIAKAIEKYSKLITEFQSNIALAEAVSENIRRNYPKVVSMDSELRKAAGLFEQKQQEIEDFKKDLKTSQSNIKNYESELDTIEKETGVEKSNVARSALETHKGKKNEAQEALKKMMKK